MNILSGATRAALAGAVLIGLSGCMSSGTQVSDDQLNGFVRGRTTESEVIARLGSPDYTERSASGEHTDMYNYSSTSTSAKSFIPIIGGLFASVNTKSRIVRFTFSARGVLEDWTVSSSGSTINDGLLNQH